MEPESLEHRNTPSTAKPVLSYSVPATPKNKRVWAGVGNVIKLCLLLPIAAGCGLAVVTIWNHDVRFQDKPQIGKLVGPVLLFFFVLWLIVMLMVDAVLWLRGADSPKSWWYQIWARFDRKSKRS